MRSIGWIPVLRAATAANGLPYCVFGDAAFGLTDVIRGMVKGVCIILMIPPYPGPTIMMPLFLE